jgi:hypothetical protein
MAEHFDVPLPESFETRMIIQRDELSEEWRERFQADLEKHGIPPSVYRPIRPHKSFRNAVRLFTGKPLNTPFFNLKS